MRVVHNNLNFISSRFFQKVVPLKYPLFVFLTYGLTFSSVAFSESKPEEATNKPHGIFKPVFSIEAPKPDEYYKITFDQFKVKNTALGPQKGGVGNSGCQGSPIDIKLCAENRHGGRPDLMDFQTANQIMHQQRVDNYNSRQIINNNFQQSLPR